MKKHHLEGIEHESRLSMSGVDGIVRPYLVVTTWTGTRTAAGRAADQFRADGAELTRTFTESDGFRIIGHFRSVEA